MSQTNTNDPIDPRSVIEAFADGELVTPEDLTHALASPDDREYFADLLVLRRLVRGPHTAMGVAGRPATRGGRLPARWWAIAAAIVVAAATGGYLGGTHTAGWSDRHLDAGEAPVPTKVIRLERGVDWSEQTGG